nr:MAG TPA: hypothetical protein [Caudoviricetes sp.]
MYTFVRKQRKSCTKKGKRHLKENIPTKILK